MFKKIVDNVNKTMYTNGVTIWVEKKYVTYAGVAQVTKALPCFTAIGMWAVLWSKPFLAICLSRQIKIFDKITYAGVAQW